MEGKKREMEMRRKVRSAVIGHASHCFYSSSLSPVVYCSINLKGGRLHSSGLLIVGSLSNLSLGCMQPPVLFIAPAAAFRWFI